jgi:predicted SAM-dependent methyltransferase
VPGLLRSLLKTIGILSDLHYKVKWPKEVLYRELTKPLPFESEQVDYVYTSHFLEHVEYSAAQQILQEIYRVLRPGGIARVIVPDLNHYISEYNKNAMEGLKDAGDIFMKGLNISLRHRDPHLWAYDFNSLTVQLNKAGFQTIERCEFKIGRCKDADKLDNRPIDSLIVEAVK